MSPRWQDIVRTAAGPVFDWGRVTTPPFSASADASRQSIVATFNHNLGKPSSNFILSARTVVSASNDPDGTPRPLVVCLDEYSPVTATQFTVLVYCPFARNLAGAAVIDYFAWAP